MKFNVPEMNCGHCTSSIEKAIKAADASARVSTDLPGHTVDVESSLSQVRLSEILAKAGFASTPA